MTEKYEDKLSFNKLVDSKEPSLYKQNMLYLKHENEIFDAEVFGIKHIYNSTQIIVMLIVSMCLIFIFPYESIIRVY
jgi:hypothetical protein